MHDIPVNKSDTNSDVLELDSDQAEISSACMSCGGTGVTRMLVTKIPHFNDIVVMSFECKECPYKNNEIQNISSLRDYGVKFQVKINDSRGLDNQIVISNTSSIKLVDIDFEIPKIERKGIITTVEGLIMDVINNLDEHIRSVCEQFTKNEKLQIELSTGNLKSAKDYIYELTKIKDKLLQYSQGLESFTMEIDDPSGNSYIEDNGCLEIETHKYTRTNNQLKEMGYLYNQDGLDNEDGQSSNTNCNDTTNNNSDTYNNVATNNISDNKINGNNNNEDSLLDKDHQENGISEKERGEWDLNKSLDEDDVDKENLCLIVDCPNCGKQGYNQICQVLVPGFGNCIIMSFICEFCGSKTNEMKAGGGYKPYGKRWKLRVESDMDLNRDVIISETATVRIEELDFEMTPGTIGSVFTSVEGVIKKIVESLESSYPFLIGDSVSDTNNEIRQRFRNLNSLISKLNFNLVLDDPIDHSFISSLSDTSIGVKNQYPNLSTTTTTTTNTSNSSTTNTGNTSTTNSTTTIGTTSNANNTTTINNNVNTDSSYTENSPKTNHLTDQSSYQDNNIHKIMDNEGTTVQPLDTEITVDVNLSYLLYERTYEQNEELGLNDINTENY